MSHQATMQRQPRPSIVIDSGSGSEFDYPGSDVLIHKKDFLIHIKKLSVRSQSSDCASENREVLSLLATSLTFIKLISGTEVT